MHSPKGKLASYQGEAASLYLFIAMCLVNKIINEILKGGTYDIRNA